AVALVLGRSLAGAAAGIALGALASLGASRGVAHYLYGVRTWDPGTYALAAAGLVAVCAAAAWLPARRAGRADPGRVLRAP
ncbi:MAG TPA: hypothetical protein VKA84_19200, partial [Gemmatimonadaceae bacterium]|nr:hypothetical protein [Gemmatimonadaceae bacterium]